MDSLLPCLWVLTVTPRRPMKLPSKHKNKINRPQPKLFALILILFSTPWIVLYILGAQVRQQKPKLDAQSAAYFSQQLPQQQNNSAESLERFMSHVGLIPNIKTHPPITVTLQSRQAFHTIKPTLNQYLQRQVTNPSGSLEAIPPELQAYLTVAQPTLEAVQQHLATQPTAQWSLNLTQLQETDYALPGFANVLYFQKLLLLSAIQHQQQGRPSKAIEMLEASWQMNQAIKQRPDLTSQTLGSIVLAQQTGLVRQLENVPPIWQARMSAQHAQHSLIEGVEFENWLRYHISQEAFSQTLPPIAPGHSLNNFLSQLSTRFSPRAYFQLAALENTASADRAIARISQLNICDVPPVAAERIIDKVQKSHWRKHKALSAFTTAKRWKIEGIRSLAMELSQHILWAKQHRKESGEWPTQLSQSASDVCPNEHWTYAVQDDKTISITFSKRLIVMPVIPLHYKSHD